MTGLKHKILTRLRQKGKPWAMMLMLNILSTFWGGSGSLETSLGSARSSGWLSSGTCKVFSFPQATFGIFLRAPDDEKRGIGQCRSIAKKRSSTGSYPRRWSKRWPTNVANRYCFLNKCRVFLVLTYRYFARWASAPTYSELISLLTGTL